MCQCLSKRIRPQPDLTASFQSALPLKVVGGAAGHLTLRISNIGDAKASGRIEDRAVRIFNWR